MVSWSHWFGACGKVTHHGSNMWWGKLSLRSQYVKEEEPDQGPTIPFEGMTSKTGSHFLKFVLPPDSKGDKDFNAWAFGGHCRSKLQHSTERWLQTPVSVVVVPCSSSIHAQARVCLRKREGSCIWRTKDLPVWTFPETIASNHIGMSLLLEISKGLSKHFLHDF